jgi:hypothetical protein
MNPLDLLPRLKGVRKSGNGWSALCPAHDDRNPSLSVSHDGDKWLLRCHANCPIDEITSALGIHVAELFDDQTTKAATMNGSDGAGLDFNGAARRRVTSSMTLPSRPLGLGPAQSYGRSGRNPVRIASATMVKSRLVLNNHEGGSADGGASQPVSAF